MATSRKSRLRPLSFVEKVYLGLLLVVFGGIVLHAPLSVGFSTLLPDYELLIKSWKEILIFIAALLLPVILRRKQQTNILKEPLMIGVGIYAFLHLISVAVFSHGMTFRSVVAGLLVDLRYVVFFVLVYVAVRLYPAYYKVFVRVGIAGALAVVVFALLQVFVLPVDVLKYIGYNIDSIAAYLTVDQNHDFIRINSTLRGPNPLGAYAVIVLSGVAAWLVTKKASLKNRSAFIIAILLLGGAVSLWASYSRSALIAAVVAIGIVILAVLLKKYRRHVILLSVAALMIVSIALFVGRNTSFVSNVILHENPAEGNQLNSNDGHIDSLQDGTLRAVSQPLGAGVGSTGSASLHGTAPLIIENQYLFIAHEVGWVGLILFVIIFIGILNRLWQSKADWLALSIFASGIGLALIGLLLPVWADDTVAIIWWGLAALAIGKNYHD